MTANIPSVPASFGPNVNNIAPTPPVNNINSTNNKENISTAPPSTTYAKEMSVREMNGYVGFANLPNQVYRKSVKKGFEFTLLIVGMYDHCFLICIDTWKPMYNPVNHKIDADPNQTSPISLVVNISLMTLKIAVLSALMSINCIL